MKKRLISLLLLATVCLSLLATGALAGEESPSAEPVMPAEEETKEIEETEDTESTEAEEEEPAQQTVEPETIPESEASPVPETVSQAPMAASAASGSCGNGLTWSLSGGTLTISGTGSMRFTAAVVGNDSNSDAVVDTRSPWYDSRARITKLVIGSGVTEICAAAFSGCANLTTVVMPESVTGIADDAFAGCTAITSAGPVGGTYNLQYAWTDKIPGYAFSCYPSLTHVTVADGVTEISDYALAGCEGLTSVVIPGSVTVIGSRAFDGCKNLTSAGPVGGDYNIQLGWRTQIPPYAFANCDSLVSLSIPGGMTEIGTGAFSGCAKLSSVTIPDGVMTIGGEAFSGCTDLKRVILPPSVTSMSLNVFAGCAKLQSAGPVGGEYDIQYRWTNKIPDYAFSGCGSLRKAAFPEKLTAIGESAFRRCGARTSLTLPDSVKTIGRDAFSGCTDLIYITLPGELRTMGSAAFSGCTALRSIKLPAGLATVEDDVFSDCASLEDAVIPTGVTGIGNRAFENCVNLRKITLPEGVKTVGTGAFYGCSMLREITLPADVTTIGYNAFRECGNLRRVTLPMRLTALGGYAFADCGGLTEIVFDGDFPSVGTDAFMAVKAKAYYCADSAGWTEKVLLNYGGTLTWGCLDKRVLSSETGTVTLRATDRWADGAALCVTEPAVEEPVWPDGASIRKYTAYDISVLNDELEGTATMTVQRPLGYGVNCRVYYMDAATGTLTRVDKDGSMTFPAERLGIYIVAKELITDLKTGDANADGAVDISDAMDIARTVVGLVALDEDQETAAKVSGGKEVSLLDAVYVAQSVVGAYTLQ